MKILILGGTAEAVELAGALSTRRHQVTTSLAGRTENPRKPAGGIHVGGFGGADGLAEFLTDRKFDYLVDATHPFASEISANAVTAAKKSGVPMVRIDRPPFAEPPQANWWRVADASQAASRLPHGATALLTIGRKLLEPFEARHDVHFLVRAIERPEIDLPDNFRLIQARPPFTRNEELGLMKREGVTHLLAKDAGGDMTGAKLQAAFMLKVQVIMLNRPDLPETNSVPGVEDALAVFDQFPAPKRFFFFP